MTHICMVSHRGCVRVGKEATALMTRGIYVSSISFERPKWSERFSQVVLCRDKEQFRRSIEMSSADIFHVHNTPDWLVKEVREVTDRPIVYDIHDPEVMRLGHPGEDEQEAHDLSNATIYPSDSCRIFTDNYFKKTVPSITLFSYVNQIGKVSPMRYPSLDSVVYEGGITHDPKSYRYYKDIFATFLNTGFNVFLLPSGWSPDAEKYGRQVIIIGPLDYVPMLKAIRSFGFGIVGSQEYIHLMHSAMPNKLFEYISVGVVPLMFNMGEASEWVTSNNIGIDMTKISGENSSGVTKKQLISMSRECRENLLKIRENLWLEDYIQPLIELYQSL